jgi:hypothetical protein
MNGDCAGCHNAGIVDPASPRWLSGFREGDPGLPFEIGPPPTPFKTCPRNLTPDNLTGLGRITDRQVFNALRFGLKPADTPDVVISSNTPGQGNYPATPKYLAPPMPWPAYRYMPDNELWDIVAYIKHGIKPVSNKVTDSQGPPDFWAGAYAPIIGQFPLMPYPAANEEFKE